MQLEPQGLAKLEEVVRSDDLRSLVSTLCIEVGGLESWCSPDDGAGSQWSRKRTAEAVQGPLDISRLMNVLSERLLEPQTITVRDLRSESVPSDLEKTDNFVRDLVASSHLVITSFEMRRDTQTLTELELGLSSERAERETDLRLLRRARLYVKNDLNSYWSHRILHRAEGLTELHLSFLMDTNVPLAEPRVLESLSLPSLEVLHISNAALRRRDLCAIIATPMHNLTSLTLSTVTLIDGSMWQECLRYISKCQSNLKKFRINILSVGPTGSGSTRFGNTDTLGPALKIIGKGRTKGRPVRGLEYEGSDASVALNFLAEGVFDDW